MPSAMMIALTMKLRNRKPACESSMITAAAKMRVNW